MSGPRPRRSLTRAISRGVIMVETCLVSMSLSEVEAALGTYSCNCFADNPSVAVRGIGSSGDSFLARSRKVRELIGTNTKLYLEIMGDTCAEMVADARRIVSEVPGNTLVKVPACPEGFRAIQELARLGIRSSCTAAFDVDQALFAEEAGAVCVAVYVSRLDRAGFDGMRVVNDIAIAFKKRKARAMVCAASIKTQRDIERAVLAGADNVTVDLALLEQMAASPF